MYDQIESMLNALAQLQYELDTLNKMHTVDREAAIPELTRIELNNLADYYNDLTSSFRQEIDQLTNQIKDTVEDFGHTVKGSKLQAVYTTGRVSWDDRFMQGYAATHEEVLQARKEGKPSVSIRKT